MSFSNSFAVLSSAGSAPGMETDGKKDLSATGSTSISPGELSQFSSYHDQLAVIPYQHLPVEGSFLPFQYDTGLPSIRYKDDNVICYARSMGCYTPNIQKGCVCSHPDAIDYVHWCIPKRKRFNMKNIPTEPKAMWSPQGLCMSNTRYESLLNKDILVSYAQAMKTCGLISCQKDDILCLTIVSDLERQLVSWVKHLL